MLRALKETARPIQDFIKLSPQARRSVVSDWRGLRDDPGIDACVNAALEWLCTAQDESLTADGGVARHFSIIDGWAPSYPETTGYIVPTFLAEARRQNRPELRERAQRMLNWLVSIQFPEGGFQGGLVIHEPRVPVTFNTGQILLGLVAGVAEFGTALQPAMIKAADWLASTIDDDGCWRRFPTPFAAKGEKSYETHVAWGLFETARLEPDRGYAEAAWANIEWSIANQEPNGWMRQCCLTAPDAPLTHTLGYALRGILEAHRFQPREHVLNAAIRTADGLLSALSSDGYLPGRLGRNWEPRARWACVTGTVQIAHSWLILFQLTGQKKYLAAGRRANQFARRTLQLSAPPGWRGGVRGSFPMTGDYGQYQFLNWAAKFFIDANRLEQEILIGEVPHDQRSAAAAH